MSPLAYYADFVTIPFIIIVLAFVSTMSLGGIALGAAAWTLIEYVIHRYLFHRLPIFKSGHDLHHDRPSGMTGVTSWHSLIIFGGLYWLVPTSILLGIMLGYLAYIVIHHAFHHWRIDRDNRWYEAKMRHQMHHRGDEVNFGLVTSFWDRVFGTYRPWRQRQPV